MPLKVSQLKLYRSFDIRIANVNTFEFEDEEALKTFANWYNGKGANYYV